VRLSLRAGCG